MNGTILKYLLLTFVISINIYAYYAHIPTEPLIKLHLILAVAPLLIIFVLKNNMVNLLLLWFFFVLFKSTMGAIELPTFPDIFLERLVWILIYFIFMFEMVVGKRRIKTFSGIEIAMIFFSAYILFSMILSRTISSHGQALAISPFLNAYGIPFSIFFISKNIMDNEKDIKKFLVFLSVIGLYLGLTGIFEYYQYKPLIFPTVIALDWVGTFYGRARGPFLQPAVNGTVIGMIIFTTFLLLLYESSKWKKKFYIISLICMLVTLLFTLTRSCWLAFLVATFMIPIFITRLRKIFISSLLILIVLSLVLSVFVNINLRTFKTESELYEGNATLLEKIVHRAKTESTVDSRFDLLKMGFLLFLDKPFFGQGYEALQKAKKEYGVSIQRSTIDKDMRQIVGIHDTLMALLVNTGLVGLSLHLFIVFSILNVYRKLLRKQFPPGVFLTKDLIVVCLGTSVVFLVNSQIFDMRFFLFPNCLFYCMAGIMAGLYQQISRNKNKSSGTLIV